MGRVYFWSLPWAETINFHQFLALGNDCSLEASQARAGLRGCCQIPARLRSLSRSGSVQARRRRQRFKKYLGERGAKRSGKEGGGGGLECENTQADANPGFHSHANTHKVSIVWAHNVAFRHKSCSIHVQNGVETAFWHSSMLVSTAHPPLTRRRPSNVKSGQMCLLPPLAALTRNLPHFFSPSVCFASHQQQRVPRSPNHCVHVGFISAIRTE